MSGKGTADFDSTEKTYLADGNRQQQYPRGPRQYQSQRPRTSPTGEISLFKQRVLDNWSQWVADYDRENGPALEKIAAEHPVVWMSPPRDGPISGQPFDATESRSFSTGNIQSRPHEWSGGSKPTSQAGAAPSGQGQYGQQGGYQRQPRGDWKQQQTQKPKSFTTAAAQPWRTLENRTDEMRREEHEEMIEWATDEAGVGMFDSEGNFKFIVDSGESTSKSPIDKSVLFGASRPPEPEKPIVTNDTLWYYRDPRGNVQGPFTNSKMLDWYSRNEFPESLPLKRSDDNTFELLAAWKARLGGICPFELPSRARASAAAPGFEPFSPFSSSPATAAPLRFGTVSPLDEDPVVNVPVRRPAVVGTGAPISPSAAVPQPTPVVPPQHLHANEEAAKKAFLEGLMGKSPKTEKPNEWAKRMENVKLEGVLAAQAAALPAKYSIVPAPASATKQTLQQAPQQVQLPTKEPSWKVVQPPTATSTPLADIRAQQEKEEQEAATKAKAAQYARSGPKSFADLLASSSSMSQATFHSLQKSPAKTQPVVAQPKQEASVLKEDKKAEAKKSDPLRDWMQQKLHPVERSVDAAFLYSLLQDCRSSDEAAALLHDNLLPAASDDFDAKSFAKEYLKKRFGKSVPQSSLDIVCPRPVDNRDVPQETEFSTFTSKKRK